MDIQKEKGNNVKLEDIFILEDEPTILKITIEDELIHEKKTDINGNILRSRKKDFIETIEKYLGKMFYIPSVIPMKAVESRILNLEKIDFTKEDLNKIRNGLEIIVEIFNEDDILIDKIRVNNKNSYINNIKSKIEVVDIKKLIGS
ncbi:MAG: hypothetical protein ACOC1K_00065 [Nanoarchaeota archaeon]